MAIDYFLRKSNITQGENTCVGRVDNGVALTMDDILSHLRTISSTVTEEEARSVLIAFQKTIIFFLRLGRSVDIGLVTFSTTLQGVFQGLEDVYDPSRHRLRVRVRPNRWLEEEVCRNLSVRKLARQESVPILQSVLNMVTEDLTGELTPGGQLRVLGKNLKFGSDVNEGIFLIPETGEARRIEPFFLRESLPSSLMFVLPRSIPPGSYNLEVRKIFGSDLKSGLFPTPVTVPEPQPIPCEFLDLSSLSNSSVTPGGSCKLVGVELSYGSDPAEGIFFVAGDGSQTRVPDVDVSKSDEELVFTAPTLASGEYGVEVRRLYASVNREGSLSGLSVP